MNLQKEAISAMDEMNLELGIQKLDEALQYLQNPEKQPCINALRNKDLEVFRAETYLRMGDYEKGATLYGKLQELFSEAREVYRNGIEERMQRIASLDGMDHYNTLKDLDQMTQEMASIEDLIAGCHHEVGKCQLAMGQYEEANRSFLRGIDYLKSSSLSAESISKSPTYLFLNASLSVLYDIVGNGKDAEDINQQIFLLNNNYLRIDHSQSSLLYIVHGNFLMEGKVHPIMKIKETNNFDAMLETLIKSSHGTFLNTHKANNLIGSGHSFEHSKNTSLSDSTDIVLKQAFEGPTNEPDDEVEYIKSLTDFENTDPETENELKALNSILASVMLDMKKIDSIARDVELNKKTAQTTISIAQATLDYHHLNSIKNPLSYIPHLIEKARAHADIDELEKSDELIKQALEISIDYTGLSGYTATILAHASKIKLTTGHHERALEYMTRALDIRSEKYGEKSLSAALTMMDLSVIYWSMHKNLDSFYLASQSMQILSKYAKDSESQYVSYLGEVQQNLSTVLERLNELRLSARGQ